MADTTKPATVKEIKEFFATEERPMGLKEMKEEWINGGLTKEEKDAIALGIGNGTLTY